MRSKRSRLRRCCSGLRSNIYAAALAALQKPRGVVIDLNVWHLGLASLDKSARATIGSAIPRDVSAGAQLDNPVLPYAGIRCTELTAEQHELLVRAIAAYVGRIRAGHDAIRMVR